MHHNLIQILKVLLFSTSEPISVKEFQKLFARFEEERREKLSEISEEGEDGGGMREESPEEIPDSRPSPVGVPAATEIRETLEVIRKDLEERDEPFRLQEGPGGFVLVNPVDYGDWVRLLRDAPKPLRLSPAALETLAVIAYRQPVTRSSMERVRGVSVDSALNKLLELELVEARGRADLPGRPIQYGTTERFLEFCGIADLSELPASDVVSPSRLDEWLEGAGNLETYDDASMGLPDQETEAKEG